MKLYLLLISIFFGISCCKKKEIIDENETYKPVQVNCILSKNLDSAKLYIAGAWNWVEEKRVDRRQQKFIYLTPQTEGYSLVMNFRNDTVRFFRNNQIDSVYTYKILLQHEITGTNYPEDQEPALVFYRLYDGLRSGYVPLKICENYLLLQHQYVSSVVGGRIWKKQ